MGKKILIFIFSISLAFSFFPTAVKANAIWIRTPFVYTDLIYEVDELKGNDLFTDMVIKLLVSKNVTIYSKNVTIEIEPWFNKIHGKPKIINITVCNKSQGIGFGYTYGSVYLSCEDYIEDLSIKENNYTPYLYPSYTISIPIEKFNFYHYLTIRIQYTIPNFVLKEGIVPFLREYVGNNLLVFYSSFQSYDTCKVENWERFILLPSEKDVLDDISGNVRMYDIYKGRWVLKMDGGEKSFIRYHDSCAKEIILPLFFTFIGFFLGVVFNFYSEYRKRKKI